MVSQRQRHSGVSTWDVIALVALGLAAVATIVVFDRLPQTIATHFDIHGNADGWMRRSVGASFLPVFGAVLWAFVRFLPRVLPRAEKQRLAGPVVPMVAAFTAIFLAAVHLVVLRMSLVPGASVNRPVFLAVAVLYVALGLVMPRVKRNGFVGVRTPWTLGSDENWARTHRVAGYAMVVAGLFAAVAGSLGTAAGVGLAIAALLLGGLVPAVYSLVLARRLER